jgi:hypothetical protein
MMMAREVILRIISFIFYVIWGKYSKFAENLNQNETRD